MIGPNGDPNVEESEIDYRDLQRFYSDQCIARRGARIIASAPTWSEVYDRLDEQGEPWDEGLIMEYILGADVIHIL